MRTRHKAHAILLMGTGQLLVLQRGWPGGTPYCTAVGGTVEPDDADLTAGLRREVMEEVGAEIGPPTPILTLTEPGPAVTVVHHYYTAHVLSLDSARRHGPELDDPDTGTFTPIQIPATADALTASTSGRPNSRPTPWLTS
jgi:8-oxo-dGTP pyrophosphatase MutT (NUDIX family)